MSLEFVTSCCHTRYCNNTKTLIPFHSIAFVQPFLKSAVHGRFVYNQYGWERENSITDDGGAVAGFHTVRLEVVGGGLTDGGRRVDDSRGQSVCGWLERGKRKVDDSSGDDRKHL